MVGTNVLDAETVCLCESSVIEAFDFEQYSVEHLDENCVFTLLLLQSYLARLN